MAIRDRHNAGILLIVGSVLLCRPLMVRGFALFDHTGDDAADLQTHPKDYWSWGEETSDIIEIKYQFDATFFATFPDPRVAAQVDLAFAQWASAHNTPKGNTYSYLRSHFNAVVDIRSVTVHEIGHVVGLYHPDAAATEGRNYSLQAGGSVAQNANPNGTEVMTGGMGPGDYFHILSHDELDAYAYAYGPNRKIVFTRVEDGSFDLRIRTGMSGGPTTCAHVEYVLGENRDNNDPFQGTRAQLMTLEFNQAFVQNLGDPSKKYPIGFQTLNMNWDYEHVSKKLVNLVEIRTRGTNNPAPLSHYDGFPGSAFQQFQTYEWDKTSPPLGPDYRDDLVHIWSSPAGAGSSFIHVGLEQDVWDWSVVSGSRVHFTDNTADVTPGFIVAQEWNHTVGTQPSPAPGTGKHLLGQTVLARGIRIVAPDVDVVSHVRTLGYADVQGDRLALADLTRDTLNELKSVGRFVELFPSAPLDLGYGEDFIVVLQGKESDLPADVRQRGNYLVYPHPELLDRELFVFVETESNAAVFGAYALLGTRVVGSTVTLGDFARLAEQWRSAGRTSVGDLDLDRDVDYVDLSLLFEQWLAFCPPNWPLR